jgi:hypothetical protein
VEGWASVVALSGGMLFVGDDVSRVEPERIGLLARLFPPSGQAAEVSGALLNRIPARLQLPIRREWGDWSVVGIANWLDLPASMTFEPTDSHPYHATDLVRGEYLGRFSGPCDLGVLEPHAVRLLSVHPDRGRPQVVGSTGHLLGEAMDLQSEVWNPESMTLTLRPSTRGPIARRGTFLVTTPDGVRHVPFARDPIELRFT